MKTVEMHEKNSQIFLQKFAVLTGRIPISNKLNSNSSEPTKRKALDQIANCISYFLTISFLPIIS